MVEAINAHGEWSDVYETDPSKYTIDENFYKNNPPVFNKDIGEYVRPTNFIATSMDHYEPSGKIKFEEIF